MYRSSADHDRSGRSATTPASASSYHRAPGSSSLAGVVGHLQHQPQLRELVAHLGESGGEGAVHDDRRGACVGQEVAQLCGDVPVVDVERGDARLERAEHRLEVLVAVVQVDPEVVLPALVAGQVGALDAAAQPVVDEHVGQPAGPLGDRSPGQPAVAEHQAFIVGASWRRSPRAARRRSVPSATRSCGRSPRRRSSACSRPRTRRPSPASAGCRRGCRRRQQLDPQAELGADGHRRHEPHLVAARS